MAEAIAALSLAANVVQFVDFASKVTAAFWDFYKKTGVSGDIPNVAIINNDLQKILECLQMEPKVTGGSDGLLGLSRACQRSATQLDEMMKPLLAAQSRNNGKRKALKVAFISIWEEEQILNMRQLLEEYRSQLVLHLLVSLRYGYNPCYVNSN
jgi:hypothetical protein